MSKIWTSHSSRRDFLKMSAAAGAVGSDGENVELAVNLNRLHLFDKQSSNSLVW